MCVNNAIKINIESIDRFPVFRSSKALGGSVLKKNPRDAEQHNLSTPWSGAIPKNTRKTV